MEPARDENALSLAATPDDDALLLAAADDPEAFAQFYRRHVGGVIAYFRRRTGDAELAADLTAETFAAALAGRRRFAPERGAAAAWLYGIARRQLVTLQRRGHVERRARRRMGMARIELTDEMLERVESIADAERARVDVALAALPGDQRDAVRARVLDDRDYDEIAAAHRVSEPTARQRVSRGLAALRTRMRSQEP
jgi:RNA polymerase sigma factor (sigma-70 family)